MPTPHNTHLVNHTFCSTILPIHHSSLLQVIPKHNLSTHDSFRRDIFKASLSVSSQPLSLCLAKPPTRLSPPSPRLKRCLWIFNGAIVPLCLCVSEWGTLAGCPYFLIEKWSVGFGALETATQTAGLLGWRQWGGVRGDWPSSEQASRCVGC